MNTPVLSLLAALAGALLALIAPQFGAALAGLIFTPLAPLIALVILTDTPRRVAQQPQLVTVVGQALELPPGRSAPPAEYLGYLLAVEVY